MDTLTYMPTEHVPVLASELVALCDPQPGDLAVDCTFGGGGHARLVADRLGPTGSLICVDRDPSARERFTELEGDLGCPATFVHGNFADVLGRLAAEGTSADIVYMDLGVSSMQIDAWERGFSYSYDAPLDMRMDQTQELSARDVVNDWPENRIAETLRELGRSATLVPSPARSSREGRSNRPRSSSTRSGTPFRPPTGSDAAIRRSELSRRFASR